MKFDIKDAGAVEDDEKEPKKSSGIHHNHTYEDLAIVVSDRDYLAV